jgi:hypothetical protein
VRRFFPIVLFVIALAPLASARVVAPRPKPVMLSVTLVQPRAANIAKPVLPVRVSDPHPFLTEFYFADQQKNGSKVAGKSRP